MFKEFLDRLLHPSAADQASISLDMATAVLMVEVMAADHDWKDSEAEAIKRLLQSQFNLTTEDVDELFYEARHAQQETNDLYTFTKQINANFTKAQKYELLVNLWRVAYSDQHVAVYENHVIRRLADLLRLEHSQFIQAKQEARKK